MAYLETKRRPQSKRTQAKRISTILRDMDKQTEGLEQIIEAQEDTIEGGLRDVTESFEELKETFKAEMSQR